LGFPVRSLAATTPEYRTNRAQAPAHQLTQYRGAWVAFSADGRRIVAGAATLERLEDALRVAGEDPQAVVLEHLAGPRDDPAADGLEFL
jgi:hypothetical protein